MAHAPRCGPSGCVVRNFVYLSGAARCVGWVRHPPVLALLTAKKFLRLALTIENGELAIGLTTPNAVAPRVAVLSTGFILNPYHRLATVATVL